MPEHLPLVEGVTDITQRKEMEETIRQSGAFLQTVIDAIPDVLLVIGTDYRIVLANRAAREMAGGIDPTVGLTCHQLSHHRDLPCAGKDEPCPLRQVIATKAPVTVTHTHYDAEGKEFFVEVSAAPVLNETGEVSYIIEACRDVTERMRLERALRLTQFSVDHAGDAVFWLGSDARFFYANARACQHLGYSREELLSMTVHDVDPNFQAEVWPKHWEELKRRGSFTFESQHRTKDGGLVPVEITVNYLEFEGKEYNCAFVRDITDRKRAEESLQKAHDELEDKVQRRTAELAKANEDLRGKEATAQHLLSKLISAHEEERARIARELHDEAGQSLAALLLRLGSLEATLPAGAEEAKRQVMELQAFTSSIVEEVRRLMQDLRPSLLDDLGLIRRHQFVRRDATERGGREIPPSTCKGVKRKLAPARWRPPCSAFSKRRLPILPSIPRRKTAASSCGSRILPSRPRSPTTAAGSIPSPPAPPGKPSVCLVSKSVWPSWAARCGSTPKKAGARKSPEVPTPPVQR